MNTLSKQQQELIKKTSLTPDIILENLDDLNEEIRENHKVEEPEKIVENETRPSRANKSSRRPIRRTVKEEKQEMDLDKQLEMDAKAATKKLAEIKAKEEEARIKAKEEADAAAAKETELQPEEKSHRDLILEALSNIPDAPTPKEIAALKQQVGENGVHVLALSEREIYVFTYLTRSQWKRILQVVQAEVATNPEKDREELLKESVVKYAVKFPRNVGSIEFLYSAPAGVLDTLYESIMMQSYFITPQQAMMLTVQL